MTEQRDTAPMVAHGVATADDGDFAERVLRARNRANSRHECTLGEERRDE